MLYKNSPQIHQQYHQISSKYHQLFKLPLLPQTNFIHSNHTYHQQNNIALFHKSRHAIKQYIHNMHGNSHHKYDQSKNTQIKQKIKNNILQLLKSTHIQKKQQHHQIFFQRSSQYTNNKNNSINQIDLLEQLEKSILLTKKNQKINKNDSIKLINIKQINNIKQTKRKLSRSSQLQPQNKIKFQQPYKISSIILTPRPNAKVQVYKQVKQSKQKQLHFVNFRKKISIYLKNKQKMKQMKQQQLKKVIKCKKKKIIQQLRPWQSDEKI